MIDRRAFLAGAVAAGLVGTASARDTGDAQGALAALRERLGRGGRLGIAATNGRRRLALDADERFAMCSTFKVPLAAAILAGVQEERWALADEIPFGEADLLDYAPFVRRNLARGRLAIEELCRAAVALSDNSAANLLLAKLGGPEALTAAMRRWGDRVSRLDRTEPELNTNLPGDPRDTTTPAAMMGLLRTLLFADRMPSTLDASNTPNRSSPLFHANRVKLANWMASSTTGRERLRAGFPAGWPVGDKTGTGANGAHNDVAFALPPGEGPVLVASFISGGDAAETVRNQVHAEVARIVSAAFA